MHKVLKTMNSIKKTSLIEFLENNKHLPEQGSEEWLKSRVETIGGSEISTILNINPYQKIKQLIMQKSGMTAFKKAPPLWFGNIFEYILQQYVEILYDTTIYETGSIPYKKSNLIKYSPDGLAIIKTNKLKKIFNVNDLENKIFKYSKFNHSDDLLNKNELLILFEFKNPYMRVIKPNEIPIYYINQPKLGMEVIDICEVSIFIESVFRFCSYNDIVNLNNKYNTFYHFDRQRYYNDPLSYGSFSLFYNKKNISEHLNNLLNDLVVYLNTHNNHQYDLSNIKDKSIINRLMENIIDYKDIKIIHHKLCINSNIYDSEDLFYFHKYNNLNKYKSEIIINKNKIINNEELEYIGIISYKMFNININPIYKSSPLNDTILNKIQDVINIVKECNSANELKEKKEILGKYKL